MTVKSHVCTCTVFQRTINLNFKLTVGHLQKDSCYITFVRSMAFFDIFITKNSSFETLPCLKKYSTKKLDSLTQQM